MFAGSGVPGARRSEGEHFDRTVRAGAGRSPLTANRMANQPGIPGNFCRIRRRGRPGSPVFLQNSTIVRFLVLPWPT